MSSNILMIPVEQHKIRAIWKGRTLWVSVSDIAKAIGVNCPMNMSRRIDRKQIQRISFGGPRIEKALADINAIIYVSSSRSQRVSELLRHEIITSIMETRENLIMKEKDKNGMAFSNAFSIFDTVLSNLEKRNYSANEAEEKAFRVVLKETGVDMKDIINS